MCNGVFSGDLFSVADLYKSGLRFMEIHQFKSVMMTSLATFRPIRQSKFKININLKSDSPPKVIYGTQRPAS